MDEADRLPFLAHIEQKAKQGSDFQTLRAIRAYRTLPESPTEEHHPLPEPSWARQQHLEDRFMAAVRRLFSVLNEREFEATFKMIDRALYRYGSEADSRAMRAYREFLEEQFSQTSMKAPSDD